MKSATYLLACVVVLAISLQNMACVQSPATESPDLNTGSTETLGLESTDGSVMSLAEDSSEDEVENGEALPESTLFAQEVIFTQDDELIDYFEEGKAFNEVGDVKAAVLAFRKALADRPEDPEVWRRLGKAHLKADALSRGLACVEKSLALDPRQIDLHQVLAEAYLDNGMPALAKDHIEVVSKSWPDDAVGPYLLGKVYSNLKMWNEAIDAYEQSLERDPFNIHAYNNLGFAALQVGKNEIASAHLETAAGMGEARPYMFNNLGLAYERQDLIAEAMVAYRRARQLDPTYVNAAVNLARLEAAANAELLASADLIMDQKIKAHLEVDDDAIEIIEVDDVTGTLGRDENGAVDFMEESGDFEDAPDGIPLSMLF
jgi:tetratricopeptide (TPR) repeat protein